MSTASPIGHGGENHPSGSLWRLAGRFGRHGVGLMSTAAVATPARLMDRRGDAAWWRILSGSRCRSGLWAALPWRTFRCHKGQQHHLGTYWSATVRDQRLEWGWLLFDDFSPKVQHIVTQGVATLVVDTGCHAATASVFDLCSKTAHGVDNVAARSFFARSSGKNQPCRCGWPTVRASRLAVLGDQAPCACDRPSTSPEGNGVISATSDKCPDGLRYFRRGGESGNASRGSEHDHMGSPLLQSRELDQVGESARLAVARHKRGLQESTPGSLPERDHRRSAPEDCTELAQLYGLAY